MIDCQLVNLPTAELTRMQPDVSSHLHETGGCITQVYPMQREATLMQACNGLSNAEDGLVHIYTGLHQHELNRNPACSKHCAADLRFLHSHLSSMQPDFLLLQDDFVSLQADFL